MSLTPRFPCESIPTLLEATYSTGGEELRLRFDQAMDQTSLPAADGANILWNFGVGSTVLGGLAEWLSPTTLMVTLQGFSAGVPEFTTRCLDTSGIKSAVGVQAQIWNDFPLVVLP